MNVINIKLSYDYGKATRQIQNPQTISKHISIQPNKETKYAV